MNRKRWTALVLAAALMLSMAACKPSQEGGPERTEGERVPAPEVLRAVTVSAGNSPDYPGPGKPDKAQLEARADEIVAFAVENSMNAILYKATPYGEAAYRSDVLPLSPSVDLSAAGGSDPLDILIDRASARNVAVYAQISPYEAGRSSDKPPRGSLPKEHPEAVIAMGQTQFYLPDHPLVHTQAVSAAAELARRYAISGLVVGDVDGAQISDYPGFYTYLTALMADISQAASNGAGGVLPVGLLLSSEAHRSENRSAFLDEACRTSVDFLVPAIQESGEGELRSPYSQALESLLTVARQYGVSVFSSLSADTDKQEAQSQLFCNNLLGLSGGVLDGFASLRSSSQNVLDLLDTAIPMMYLEGGLIPDYSFDIPTEFQLTRPLDGQRITVDSSWEHYYITGISDPSSPVFCGGQEIERPSTNGTFGYFADLEYGDNTFTFTQNGEEQTATLYRPRPDTITKSSAISTYISSGSPGTAVFQPAGPQVVTAELPLLLQCKAPSGGTVTAVVNGETFELEQTADAEDGVLVLFKKEVRLSAPDPNSVVSAGKVTYTLEYDGNTSEAEAPGEVFLVGKNRTPMFRVAEGIGTVFNLPIQDGDFLTTLKSGSVGEITGQTANYFLTSYDGAIVKSSTTIVTDLETPENHVSSAEFLPADERGDEALVIHGSLSPSFIVDDDQDGNLTIRLIETYGLPDGEIPVDSRFFRSVRVTNQGGTATITFQAGAERYFGYNVGYDGEDTVLSFKAKPALSGFRGRPLLGLTIVVDAGHGADDVGALGVPGTTGPMEKNVNLYAALITRRLLEGLGATVYMTRETDEEFLSIYERVQFTEQHNADLFISMHHNSLNENLNASLYDGTYVYWYNDISEGIAEEFLSKITAATGRDAMGTEKGWYVVCRNTLAPSVLLELGFMPNEREYEEICNRDNMLSIAGAVCEAVVDYVGSL